MAEMTPKLPSSTSGNLPDYSPISWTAVASLIVAGLFFVILISSGLSSFIRKESLIQPWLLFVAVLAVVLAFVARRQIRASEGTRTGEKYANVAWYLGVIGGLGYLMYLFAIEFAVRNDAEREFSTFSTHMTKLDPNNPADPELYAAIYETISPGKRSALRGPNDVTTMDEGFKDAVLGFKACDLARICQRNANDCKFTVTGFIDWNQRNNEIVCTLKAILTTPEGEHDLVVPMQAEVDAKKQRRWFIVPSKDGYVRGKRLTPYGWEIEAIEYMGREATAGLFDALASGNATFAYFTFVDPTHTPESGSKLFTSITASAEARQGTMGSWGGIFPLPANYNTTIYQNIFQKADGKKPTDYEVALYKNVWNTPQRLVNAGRSLKTNVDTFQAVLTHKPKIEYQQSAELILSPEGQNPPTARAHVTMQLTDSDEATLRARLAQLKEESKTAALTAQPTEAMRQSTQLVNWRLVRISSDLKPVPVNRDESNPGGGPGGMMGGMMGG